MSEKPEQLSVCYPEVMPGVTKWCHSHGTEFPGGIVAVSENGLRHVLLMIKRMQAELFQGGTGLDDAERRFLKESCSIWCEGKLIASGLFVIAEPVINEAAMENEAERIDGPSA